MFRPPVSQTLQAFSWSPHGQISPLKIKMSVLKLVRFSGRKRLLKQYLRSRSASARLHRFSQSIATWAESVATFIEAE